MTDHDPRASAQGLEFLRRLENWAATDVSTTTAAARDVLLAHLRAEQAANGDNGLVHQLAARALDVATSDLQGGVSPADLRLHLAQSCVAERTDLEAARAAVARTATALVPQSGAWIGTLGGSSTVALALLELQRRGYEPYATWRNGHPVGICWMDAEGHRFPGTRLGADYGGKRFFERIGGIYGERQQRVTVHPERLRPYDVRRRWDHMVRALARQNGPLAR